MTDILPHPFESIKHTSIKHQNFKQGVIQRLALFDVEKVIMHITYKVNTF